MLFRRVIIAALCIFPSASVAETMVPAPILDSGIVLQLGPALPFAPPSSANNFASPVAVEDTLYVVNQQAGIGIWNGSSVQTVLDSGDLPEGVNVIGREAFLNIAGSGNTVYVAFTSSTVPDGLTVHDLPADNKYNTASDAYHLIYRYSRQSDGSLTDAQGLAALRLGNVHYGGGMLVLPDGNLLIATGDNVSWQFNGLEGAQDENEIPGKLLIVDGATGNLTTAAVGVRNTQRLAYANEDKTLIAFSDIGRATAEEINVISVSDVLDTSIVENFGWGEDPDGLAREGTFYISDVWSGSDNVRGVAPLGEAGFIQPYAQFGREEKSGIAVSGPLFSTELASEIELLFGDLRSGELYATLPGSGSTLADVYDVTLLDQFGSETSFAELTDAVRADLRLFSFADGSPGLLFERGGNAYSLSLLAPVPLGSSAGFLAFATGLLALRRRTGRLS